MWLNWRKELCEITAAQRRTLFITLNYLDAVTEEKNWTLIIGSVLLVIYCGYACFPPGSKCFSCSFLRWPLSYKYQTYCFYYSLFCISNFFFHLAALFQDLCCIFYLFKGIILNQNCMNVKNTWTSQYHMLTRVLICKWLDSLTLKVFSNLNDLMNLKRETYPF